MCIVQYQVNLQAFNPFSQMFCTRQREHKEDDGFKLGQQKPRDIRYVLKHQIITATSYFPQIAYYDKVLSPPSNGPCHYGDNFVWWRLIFMDPEFGTCFMLLFLVSRILSWFLEVWKICALVPWTTSISMWMSYVMFMFMVPCFILYSMNNQQMQLYALNFIPLLGSLYMFRVFYTPIIRSTILKTVYVVC